MLDTVKRYRALSIGSFIRNFRDVRLTGNELCSSCHSMFYCSDLFDAESNRHADKNKPQ
jgi:hypothetical protein